MNPLAIRIAADLKAFKANMAEMRVQLETNQSAMKRMSSAFDGSKVIGDANAMVKAIGGVAGAAKLTDAEMRRVNATTTEAIEKYKRLGREAPPELLALRDATNKVEAATKQVAPPVDSLSTKLKGLAGTLGLAFGGAAVVSGLKSLVKGTFDYAENITDLAARMDVSTDAAQGWKFATEKTGSSLEDVSKSVLKLSQGLSGGDKGLVKALSDAGQDFQKIRAMKPEDAFNAVAAAVAKVPDPMDQARIVMEAFGKSGLALLPAIRQGMIDIANEAPKMSAATIKALDDAKDKWAEFTTGFTVSSGNALASGMGFFEEVGRSASRFSVLLSEGREGLRNYMLAEQDLTRTQKGLTAELTATQKAAVDSFNAMKGNKVTTAEFAATMGVAVVTVQKYLDSLKPVPKKLTELTAEEKAAAAAALRLAEAFQKNVDVLTGKALTREVEELAKQVAAAGKQGGLSAFQYQELGKKLSEMVAKGASLTTTLQNIRLDHERLNPSIKTTVNDYKTLIDVMKLVKPIRLGNAPPPLSLPVSLGLDVLQIGQLKDKFGVVIKGLGDAPEFKTLGDKFVTSFAKSLEGLGGVIVGAIQGGGDVGRAAFAHIGASLGDDLGNAIRSGLSKQMKNAAGDMVSQVTALGKILGGLAGPLGALLGGAVGGLLDKMFGKNQGRDDAKAFAASFGGFDALRKEMLSLGAEGDRLWIALTQNTKGPQQVAAIIKQIEDALAAAEAQAKKTGKELEDTFKGPEGARGFPTRAQLETAAREAEEAYRYVRDSGLYTADVIEQAWDQWQDAMIASGDETAKRMKELQSEILTLQKAVEAETPEYDANGVRMYGVEELRNIERLAALEKEKAALNLAQIAKELHATEEAAAAADLTAKKEFEAAKLRAINLDEYLRKLFMGGYEIPITFRLPGQPPSGGAVPPGSSPSFFGGGSTPRSSGGTATSHITVVIPMDGEVVARKTVTHTAKLLPNELSFMYGIHQ